MKFHKTITLLFCTVSLLSCKKLALPYVTTNNITDIQGTTASSGGVITGEKITQKGVCWSTSPNPSISSNKTSNGAGETRFESKMTDLTPQTVYYVRAYATNKAGTAYGSELVFSTGKSASSPVGSLTDLEGNVYKTVMINGREWMAENLRSTRYRNGDQVPYITETNIWNGTNAGAYCYYNSLESNKNVFGMLYNYMTLSDSRKIAPPGWHVASLTEWQQLITHLGGNSEASNKLRAVNTLWSSNPNANNQSGFSALPGGSRLTGSYYGINSSTRFWTSSIYGANTAYFYELNASTISLQSSNITDGYSVRCIKD